MPLSSPFPSQDLPPTLAVIHEGRFLGVYKSVTEQFYNARDLFGKEGKLFIQIFSSSFLKLIV